MPSRYRRAILVAGVGTLLAGCGRRSAEDEPETPSIADRFDCADAERPEPDVEAGAEITVETETGETKRYETVGSTQFPHPPESLDADAVVRFLKEYEATYRQNYLADVHGEELIEFDIEFDDVRSLDREGDVQRFLLVSESVIRTVELAGHDPRAVAYGIDSSGLVRLDRVEPDDRDDPEILEDGTLTACF